MTPEDHALKQFLDKVIDRGKNEVTLKPEQMQEFFRLVRDQAISDVADYITRFGTAVVSKIPDKKFAKKIRDLFYGCAGEIRAQGRAGRELAQKLMDTMKPGVTMDDVVGPAETAGLSAEDLAKTQAAVEEQQEADAKAEIDRMREEARRA